MQQTHRGVSNGFQLRMRNMYSHEIVLHLNK